MRFGINFTVFLKGQSVCEEDPVRYRFFANPGRLFYNIVFLRLQSSREFLRSANKMKFEFRLLVAKLILTSKDI